MRRPHLQRGAVAARPGVGDNIVLPGPERGVRGRAAEVDAHPTAAGFLALARRGQHRAPVVAPELSHAGQLVAGWKRSIWSTTTRRSRLASRPALNMMGVQSVVRLRIRWIR